MGLVYTTPMGATGGAGTFTAVDNSAELGAIAIALEEIAATLLALNLNLQATFGPGAALVPGTVANSLKGVSDILAPLTSTLADIKNSSAGPQTALTLVAGHLAGINSTLHSAHAVQSGQAADQIFHNSYQRAATDAALARNNLPPVEPPPIVDTMKTQLKNGVLMHELAEFQTILQKVIDDLINRLKDFIINSAPIIFAQECLATFATAVTTITKEIIRCYIPSINLKDILNSLGFEFHKKGIRTSEWASQIKLC